MVDASTKLPESVGRYHVVRLLGHGAMGRVLLAHDPVLDRDVAIKHLRGDLEVLPEQRLALVERMKQEARASARVSHPGIVALHDMGEDHVLGWFLVFEYVEGETLKGRLERGPLPAGKVAEMARNLGGALSTAHRAGVVHRDIKPENVMLASTGAKIADFGIARVPDSTLTSRGKLLGTPAYSAPEAIGNGRFSSKSDQFSLAATLYESLSGRRAFPGDDAVAVAAKISTEEPPAIAAVCGVDIHTDTVFARAFSKNPRSRFDTCEDFGNALAEALTMSVRSAQPTVPDEVHRRQKDRLTLVRGIAVALGAFVVGIITTNIVNPPPPQSARSRPTDSDDQAPEKLEPSPVAWLSEKKSKVAPRAPPAPSATVAAPAKPTAPPVPTQSAARVAPPAPVKNPVEPAPSQPKLGAAAAAPASSVMHAPAPPSNVDP